MFREGRYALRRSAARERATRAYRCLPFENLTLPRARGFPLWVAPSSRSEGQAAGISLRAGEKWWRDLQKVVTGLSYV